MIQLQGSREFTVAIDQLYPELADLSRLVKTLPDVKTVKEAREDHAVVIVAPGFSFVKGELETTIVRASAQPLTQAELQVHSKGIGASVKILASFTLTSQGQGTLMNWQAAVQELGGLLKLVPSGLLKGAAQKVIDNWLNSLQQRLTQAMT